MRCGQPWAEAGLGRAVKTRRGPGTALGRHRQSRIGSRMPDASLGKHLLLSLCHDTCSAAHSCLPHRCGQGCNIMTVSA